MEILFAKLLSMSFAASWLILAVLLLRLVLCRAPKWSRCVLWALVGLRLVLPISLESSLSLIPRLQTASQPVFDEKVFNFTGATAFIPSGGAALQGQITYNAPETITGPGLMTVLSWIWLAGVILLLGYALVSALRLRRRVAEAVPIGKMVCQCDRLDTPFILGVVRPRIYLPSDLPPSAVGPVLAHEQAHLSRRDHWWKPLGFLLLAVYWFHPLVWLAYYLFCRDLELACDERAIRNLDGEGRRAYSLALLNCSVDRRTLAACPLAFGEGSVKGRIKAVLNYRRPTFWLVLAAVAACVTVAVCFLTDPVDDPALKWIQELTPEQVASVDLVVLPQSQDKQYRQIPEDAIPAVVELLSHSRGNTVRDPEILNGQSIWFYLTLTDGTRHEVGNMGNTYLVIDGNYYDAPYDWLSTWEDAYGVGDSPLPEEYFDSTLTLDEPAALFAAIASSPADASFPGAYLAAHPEEHQALLDGGRDTLCYIFTQFLAGDQTGLEGHLMRLVLDELAPEAQLKLAADTGQEYFDAWREAAEGALAEHGAEWMEENQPAMWLMLQMSQAEP